MIEEKPETPTPTIRLSDIYFVIFRHKWMIAACTILGILAAAGIYFLSKPSYISGAKILIRYVTDNAALTPSDKSDRVKSPDNNGITILNSEIQILTSRDLAEQVVDLIGPDKFLAKAGGGTNRNQAIGLILGHLKAEIPPNSSVIAVTFEYPDPEMVQLGLKLLVEQYLEKHNEIHRAVGAYDFLSKQTDQLRTRLNSTEEDLRKIRNNAGVVSLNDKEGLAVEMTQLRGAIGLAEVDLESRKASLKEREKWLGRTTNAVAAPKQASAQDLGQYKSIMDGIHSLRTEELKLLATQTDLHPQVQGVRAQIAGLEIRRRELEAANSELALTPLSSSDQSQRTGDLMEDVIQVAALDAKLKVLKAQWEKLRTEASNLEGVENSIKEIERRKELEESNLRYFSASLEKARIDQALDAGKISNLGVVQAASVPVRNVRLVQKAAGIALVGGLGLGLLLAFGFEFVINQTIKRPADFQKSVHIPLLLTIPDGRSRSRSPAPLPAGPADGVETPARLEPTVWENAHPLKPYFEALRDRILVSFEDNPRKPKLVGVTACSHGAGSSSIAAGLAAALSETGDGNVLLVDVNLEHGLAHAFFHGKPACALHEAIEDDKRAGALVQDNLYLATINQTNGSASSKVPSKKFAELVPKFRASDYDYIIFDMPPVSETSLTFRMAGYMDKVLMVVESGKTQRSLLLEAQTLLRRSTPNIEAVLNKHRQYVPKALHHELNGS